MENSAILKQNLSKLKQERADVKKQLLDNTTYQNYIKVNRLIKSTIKELLGEPSAKLQSQPDASSAAAANISHEVEKNNYHPAKKLPSKK